MRTTYYHFVDSTVGIGATYHTLANGTINEFGVGVSSHIGIGTFNKFAQFAIHHDGPASESNRTGGLEINANTNAPGDKHGARILAYNRVGRDPNDSSVKIKGYRRLRFAASEYQFETPDNPTDTSRGGPRVNISGIGSVGIGTTTPQDKLHIHEGDIVIGQDSGANTGIRNYIKFGRVDAPKAAIGFINNIGNGRGDIIFMNSNGNNASEFTEDDEVVRITRNGRVGIGSTVPEAKLDVFGNIKLSDTDPEIQLNTGGPRFRVPEDNTLTIHSGGDSGSESLETVRISQSGYIGVGTANPTAPLVVRNSNNTLGILTSTDDGANLDLFDDDTQSRIRTVNGRLHLYADFNYGVGSGNVAGSSIRFFVDGNNEKFKIDGDGQVVYTPMTTAQRDALTGQTGGVIFNSSTSKLQVYDGSAWVDLH